MSIPPIAPYALGDLAPRSTPQLDWKVDPDRAALLVHDMQNYFVDVYEPDSEPLASVVPNIVALRDAADAAGMPVILTAQPPRQHPSRRGLLTDRWGPGIRTDEEAQVIEELSARPGDITVVKWRYSAFSRTDLRSLLAHDGRDQLLITGIYAHIGCLLTAADAFMHDVQAFFVTDGVADFNAAFHSGAIDYVNTTCGMAVSTDDALRAIKSDG
ncbi:isochorismatase [Gordonia araii NBRC 100433]|uniref:Isochorismatase n=1 Tax=Gordonia araii NBRC 100433 TaxID=1073574 RepID=G7GZ98_9ACTN|nr:isochorismatase family protein [Gordonia araii]NNG97131.1 isochorismatase family protein [Gordonia araii NBRC 100433]GAB08923.1 isochorismatase [Gordonia araii NBRC 100433]